MPAGKEMNSFKAFHLPLLALQEVSKHWSLCDLFALSTQSKKSQKIIRTLCSHRKFDLCIDFQKDGSTRLCVSEENSNETTLTFSCWPLDPKAKAILKGNKQKISLNFENCSEPIVTVINLGIKESSRDGETTDMVVTFWKPSTKPYQVVVPHLAKLFQNLSVQVLSQPKTKEFVSGTIDFLKNLSLKIHKLTDFSSSYSFDEVKQMMKIYKDIGVNTPKLTTREQKSLFKIFMEDPNRVQELVLLVPQTVEMRHLERVLDEKPVKIFGAENSLKLERPSDGRVVNIYSEDAFIVFTMV